IWYFGELLPMPLYSKILHKLVPADGIVEKEHAVSYGVGFLNLYYWLSAVIALGSALPALESSDPPPGPGPARAGNAAVGVRGGGGRLDVRVQILRTGAAAAGAARRARTFSNRRWRNCGHRASTIAAARARARRDLHRVDCRRCVRLRAALRRRG